MLRILRYSFPSEALLALPLTLCQSVSLGYEAGPLVQRGLSWERQTLAKGGEMTKAEISLACGCDAEKGAIGGTGTRRGGGRI